MNKSLIIGIAVVIVIVGGISIYSFGMGSKNDGAIVEKEEGVMTSDKEGEVIEKDDGAMIRSGSYEAYSAEKITKASTSDVVLFFRASWCPTCRALDSDISSHLKDIPESLTILQVDYDNSSELKKKYGITYQHTFVQVDAQGQIIKKWSGSRTLADLVLEVK